MSLILPSSELILPANQPVFPSASLVEPPLGFDPKPKKKPTLKPVFPSKAVGNAYLIQLNKIVDQMHKDVMLSVNTYLKSNEKKYNRKYTADSWVDSLITILDAIKRKYTSPVFESVAQIVASRFVTSANNYNLRKNRDSVGINALGEQDIQDYLKVAIRNNVGLITSIPDQYFQQIEQGVLDGINRGASHKELERFILDRYQVTRSRAKLIARDQTAKVNGQLTLKRQLSAGIRFFQWVTSKDERVREAHKLLSLRHTTHGVGVYSWADPPLGQKGRHILPGEEFQCRCIAKPVLATDVKNGALF